MPPDGTMSGAEPTGSVSEVNTPQTPVMVSPSGQVGPVVSPDQKTTKPRQEPGGGGMDFDPKANGSDGGPGSPLSPDPPADPTSDEPPAVDEKTAGRMRLLAAKKVNEVARTIRAENPGMNPHAARLLARETVERFPMMVQADWHGLDYGNRPGVPDGQWTHRVRKGPSQEGEPGEPQEPQHEPARIAEDHPAAAMHLPAGVMNRILPGGTPAEMAGASEVAAESAGLARFLPMLAL